MKIGIIGNYGATNIGDESILDTLIKSLYGHEVTVFSADPDKTMADYGVRSVHVFPFGIRSAFKFGFQESIRALKEVDVVIFGGGGLFQDDYLYACFLWAWQIYWVKHFKKPLFFYGTGVGPLNTKLGKSVAKWAFSKADMITVRDGYSCRLLEKMGITENVYVTADPVFTSRTNDVVRERTKNLFIISLRPWLDRDKAIIDSFSDFLEHLKREKNAEFIFVCMQQIKEHDHTVIGPLITKFGGEIYIPKHFSDLIKVMQTAEFAIGMRYHFLIAALITKTPVIPISYSPKVDELFKGTPMASYLIPVDGLSGDKLHQCLKKLSVDYNNVIVYENVRINQLRSAARKNTELFKDFIKRFDQTHIE